MHFNVMYYNNHICVKLLYGDNANLERLREEDDEGSKS